MSITLTERAVEEVRTIMKQQDLKPDNAYLRVGVQGGGCSGFSYALDLTDTKEDQDQVFEADGIKIVCDPQSLLQLSGTQVDFRDEMMGRGFTFNNPNATSSCGCGTSFSV